MTPYEKSCKTLTLAIIVSLIMFVGIVITYILSPGTLSEIAKHYQKMTSVELAAVVFVISGVWLIAKPSVYGLYLMAVAQVLWTWYSFKTCQIALCFQSIMLFLINLRGIRNWRKIGL